MRHSLRSTSCGLTCLLALWVGSAGAAEAEKKPTLRVIAVTSGLGFSRANTWGQVDATISNPTDAQTDYLLCVFREDLRQVQFCKRLWLPPHSQRVEWLPVRAGEFHRDSLLVPLKALLLDERSNPEQQVVFASGELAAFGGRLSVAVLSGGDERVLTGSVEGLRRAFDPDPQNVRVAYLSDEAIPGIESSLQGLDCLIIARPKPTIDAAQGAALRRWLAGGGRLWIMLDRVDPEAAAQLLGDDWHGAVVDRVGLTDLTIQKGRDRLHLASDTPVHMVRMLPGAMNVTQTANGWPAAMRLDVGRGAVLLTTVELRDGVNTTIEGDKDVAAFLAGDFLANAALSPMLVKQIKETPRAAPAAAAPPPARTRPRTLPPGIRPPPDLPKAEPAKPPPPPPLPAEAIRDLARARIGEQILGRGVVAAVLGTFCAAMLAAGWLLHRAGHLERIAWVGSGLAIVAAGALVVPGTRLRAATPQTISVAAYAELDRGQATVLTAGSLSVYAPSGTNFDLAVRSGILWPDLKGQTDKTVRLVFSNLDGCTWKGMEVPAGGTRSLEFATAIPLPRPVSASARFGPEGLSGTLLGDNLDDASDLVLAAPAGRLAPRLAGRRSFSAGPNDALTPDQFVGRGSLGMVSDEQRSHSAVYRAILNKPQPSGEAALYLWTASLDPGVSIAAQARRMNATVLALPLVIDHSTPGTRVKVPAALVPFSVDHGAAGRAGGGTPAKGNSVGPAVGPGRNERASAESAQGIVSEQAVLTAYDKGEWIPIGYDGVITIRFRPPPQVLPMRLESARFRLDIDPAGRSVALLDGRSESPRLVTEQFSPTDPMVAELIDKPAVVRLGDEVRVLVRVRSSGSPQTQSASWKVRGVSLDLSGMVE